MNVNQEIEVNGKIVKGSNNETKVKFIRYLDLIVPIATYRLETRRVNKEDEKKINALELRCFRKILRVSVTEKRTNLKLKYFRHTK